MASSATLRVATKPSSFTVKSMDDIEIQAAGQSDVLKKRLQDSAELSARLGDLGADMADAVARGDIDKMRIINATYSSSSSGFQDLSKGLSGAMVGFAETLNDVGKSVQMLKAFEPDEQALIDNAQSKAEAAKGRVEVAERELTGAYGQTSLLGIKARAVKNAQTVLDSAKSDLNVLEAAVETAKQLAEQKRRVRLEGMSLEQSLMHLQTATEEVVQTARDRIKEIEENLAATEAGGKAAATKLEELSQQRAEAAESSKRLTSEISTMKEEQGMLTANSPEWVTVGNNIADKQRQLDEFETTHNNTVALYQETQRFIEMYKVQEKTQRIMRKSNQVWIEMLSTGVKERTVLYLSHLGLVRAADDQRAMQSVDEIALRVDEDVSMNAAEFAAATSSALLKRLEDAPEDIRRIRDINDAMEATTKDFQDRFQVLLKGLSEDWEDNVTPTTNNQQTGAAA